MSPNANWVKRRRLNFGVSLCDGCLVDKAAGWYIFRSARRMEYGGALSRISRAFRLFGEG